MGVRSEQCSCSQGTCRLIKTHNMNAKLLLVLAIGGQCVLGRRQLRGMEEGRDPRSLVNSFPFNANDQGHHDHHDHHGDHGDHAARNPVQNLAARDNRQAQATVKENPTSFDDVAGASPGPDGKRCIDKVEMIEEIEYDDVVQCDHSYDKRCHTTYVTNYDSQQEEECEENFRKSCFIEYEQIAFNETVEICRTPILKDCKHVTKLVPKLSPVEECVDVPKEVCTRSRTNPRPVKKPVVKKWCYVPSEESGLA